MKIEVKPNKEEKKYPWLGIDDDGDICIFTEKNIGLLIFMEHGKPDGEMDINDKNYDESGFKQFNGTITLSNG